MLLYSLMLLTGDIRPLAKLFERRVIQSVAKNLRPKAEGSTLTNQPSGYALRFFATL